MATRSRTFAPALLAVVVTATCRAAVPASAPAPGRAAITRAAQTLSERYMRGDASGIVALYLSGGLLLPPSGGLVRRLEDARRRVERRAGAALRRASPSQRGAVPERQTGGSSQEPPVDERDAWRVSRSSTCRSTARPRSRTCSSTSGRRSSRDRLARAAPPDGMPERRPQVNRRATGGRRAGPCEAPAGGGTFSAPPRHRRRRERLDRPAARPSTRGAGGAEQRAPGHGHVGAERAEAQPEPLPHAAQPAKRATAADRRGRGGRTTPDHGRRPVQPPRCKFGGRGSRARASSGQADVPARSHAVRRAAHQAWRRCRASHSNTRVQ
jgi:hypothetical protein